MHLKLEQSYLMLWNNDRADTNTYTKQNRTLCPMTSLENVVQFQTWASSLFRSFAFTFSAAWMNTVKEFVKQKISLVFHVAVAK